MINTESNNSESDNISQYFFNNGEIVGYGKRYKLQNI